MTGWLLSSMKQKKPEFPTNAVVRVFTDKDKAEGRCFGIQLERRFFLTARHCLGGPMRIVVGQEAQLRVITAAPHPTRDLALLITEETEIISPPVSLGLPSHQSLAYFGCKQRLADVICSLDTCESRKMELLAGDSGCPVFSGTSGELWGLGVSQRMEGAQVALISAQELRAWLREYKERL